MGTTNRTKEISLYNTWYDFKKDSEKHVGHPLLNWDWLKVKPKTPLPWDDSHMQATLSAIVSLKKHKGRSN